ncbi:hypothetical protein NDU88_003036 [Pleurodeles waltl]|uniref:Reverse transcriptase domain-containing protein n=1 Tax=Pleurodeles waltl TaxID=8319 RepID=A0AAV7T4K1_PLEWA|nr:hypothetical protein NDU88_003036 [Pleurodeles waltl]
MALRRRARGKPVCARPRLARTQRQNPWALHRTPPSLSYDAASLHALNNGRDQHCCQAAPKLTHGPFACRNCHFACDRTSKPTTTRPNHLRCILLNTCSARKHAVELWDLLDSTAPDVAFLTETWWNDSSAPDIAIAIPDGYKISRRDRTNGLRRRTRHRPQILPQDHHPHRRPLQHRRASTLPDPHQPQHHPQSDRNSTMLISNLKNLGLRQLVTPPTHATGHTLDTIFSTSDHVTFKDTTEPYWTDHHCIHFTYNKNTAHHHSRHLPRHNWGKVTEEQLLSTLSQKPANEPTDPDTAACNFRQWINNCANILTPLKKPPSNLASKKASWFTNELLASKRAYRKLEKKWLQERTPDNHVNLKDATRRHHHLIRTTKRASFKDRRDNNAHDSKELFRIVKELSTPNVNDIPPSQELCDSLAAFFHSKIADIYSSFNTPTTPTSVTTSNPSIANPITAWSNVDDATRKIMNSIHSGSPTDPCPHHIFNKADSIIAPQLRKIINASFETGTFPESWKHADINALLKKPKADPKDLKNFRPISLLPYPAKVAEKIVNLQLTRHIEDNNVLDPSQTGFRCNHSTETALIAATDDIRRQLDHAETSALILLDLSAAFDTVCHRTLLSRLQEAGLQEKALA